MLENVSAFDGMAIDGAVVHLNATLPDGKLATTYMTLRDPKPWPRDVFAPEVPRLRELMRRDAVREDELVLVEVPLLFEIGWESRYSHTIAIWSPRNVQIARLMVRNDLTREQAKARLDVQMSADAKLARADFGLINNGGLEHLRKQCFELIAQLKSTLS